MIHAKAGSSVDDYTQRQSDATLLKSVFDGRPSEAFMFLGDYNDDLDVTYEHVEVTGSAQPGAVWRRITEVGGDTVLHLINLVGQLDTAWDGPREAVGDPGVGTLRIRRLGSAVPRVRLADPDSAARLRDVEVTVDGAYATAVLPAPGVWQLVVVDPHGGEL